VSTGEEDQNIVASNTSLASNMLKDDEIDDQGKLTEHIFLTSNDLSNNDGEAGDSTEIKLTESMNGARLHSSDITNGARLHSDDTDKCPSLSLNFPVTIKVSDLVPTSSISVMGNSTSQLTVQSIVDRNKRLFSMAGKSRNNNLTPEEEERIKEILQEEDDAIVNCIMPSIEEDREAELDMLLNGLGYCFDNDEDEKDTKPSRGDPILRELAQKKALEEKENSIDKALRTLLREPLPRVIRFLNEENTGDAVSLLSLNGDSLVATLSEDDILELVQSVKEDLEVEKLELADHDSVRELATSILNGEVAKSMCRSIASGTLEGSNVP
jgi:hypothetical protein